MKPDSTRFWNTAVIIALIGGLLLLWSVLESRDHPAAPPFDLTMLDGARYRNDTLRGQAVVINFWATWCPPCREEAPALARVWQRFREQRVQFIGVVSRDSAVGQIPAFLQEFGLGYPNGIDNGINAAFAIDGFPMTVVLDPHGRIVERFIAGVSEDELARAVERALG